MEEGKGKMEEGRGKMEEGKRKEAEDRECLWGFWGEIKKIFRANKSQINLDDPKNVAFDLDERLGARSSSEKRRDHNQRGHANVV